MDTRTMKMQLSEIATYTHGSLSGQNKTITSVSIDTRTLSANSLYIAIKGQNFDGHHFTKQAEAAGAIAILAEKQLDTSLPTIIVKNSLLALAQLAGAWKASLSVKTIGITGSNGKTTVKEMTAAILAVNAQTLSTKGNLNNEIGVPLTLLQLQPEHQYAVIEMGANHAGEIKYSSHYTKPDITVITNVGSAHIEGFGSLEQTAHAKGEIIGSLAPNGVAVLNKDDPFFSLWTSLAAARKIISLSVRSNADVSAKALDSELKNNTFRTHFTLVTKEGDIAISLQLAGEHNVANALAAAASCLQLGISLTQIKQGLESLQPVTGRLEPLLDDNGNLFIDDTYNANPSSLSAALTILKQCNKKPWLVLGAFGEMGSTSPQIHQEMGLLIKKMGVARLFTVGNDTQYTVEAFGSGASFFQTQEELISSLKQAQQGSEVILVKGSRQQKMENIIAAFINDFRQ